MLLMINPSFADLALVAVSCVGLVVMFFDLAANKKAGKVN